MQPLTLDLFVNLLLLAAMVVAISFVVGRYASIPATRQQGLDQALSAADGHLQHAMSQEQSRQILRKMQKFFGMDAGF